MSECVAFGTQLGDLGINNGGNGPERRQHDSGSGEHGAVNSPRDRTLDFAQIVYAHKPAVPGNIYFGCFIHDT